MSYTNGLDKPSDYFDTTLYSGNDGTQSITSLDFQPDFLWIKSRNTATNNTLMDVIRGTAQRLLSDSTNAESTPTYPYVSSFDTNGWTMDDGSLSGGNTSGRTYVGWSWLAGGTASSNTDGSITSQVSASTTSGFSIVSYTGNGSAGSTIGHSLGTTPSLMIFKDRDNTRDWIVYHKDLGATKFIKLNLTDASGTSSAYFNNTEPTSSLFTVGSGTSVNNSGTDYIAYCFAEKKSFSKFGSYTGNGSTNGTFVYTGFKPAFIMWKASSASGGNWGIIDNKRAGYNSDNDQLYANLSNAENNGASFPVDILSNGFKNRYSSSTTNASGVTYIYMAFASNPFVTSTGVPATAR